MKVIGSTDGDDWWGGEQHNVEVHPTYRAQVSPSDPGGTTRNARSAPYPTTWASSGVP